MRNQLLLIEDVEDLGRSGDVVTVKPGYARNYLIPQKKAVTATKTTMQMQAKLQQERAKKALVDKKEAEEIAEQIKGKEYTIKVKVDPEGHMYGSVSLLDITKLLEAEGMKLEKRAVQLAHPIKSLGTVTVNVRLKEGVMTHIILNVESETPLPLKPVKKAEIEVKEEPTQET